MLEELRRIAEVRRAARRRLANATSEFGHRSTELEQHRQAHAVATERWVQLIRAAVAERVPVADVARAAGVAVQQNQDRSRSSELVAGPVTVSENQSGTDGPS